LQEWPAQPNRELGISAEQLRATDANGILLLVADASKKITNEQERMAKVARVLGADNQRLILSLKDGGAAFAAVAEEAKKMGLVISNETIAASEDLNDQLTILKKTMSAEFTRLFIDLAPAIFDVGVAFLEAAKATALFFKLIEKPRTKQGLIGALKDEIVETEMQLASLEKNFILVNKAANAGNENAIKARETLKEAIVQLTAELDLQKQKMDVLNGVAIKSNKITVDITQGTIEEQKALKKLRDERIKQAEAIKNSFPTLDALRERMQALVSLRQEGLIDDDQFKKAALAANEFGDTLKEVKDTSATVGKGVTDDFDKAAIGIQDFNNLISSGLADTLLSAEQDFGAFSASIIKAIGKMVLQQLLFNSLFGNKGVFSAFNPTPGGVKPGKAAGGSVAAGRAFLVGEKGPEIFKPSGAGRIIPNNQLQGNGGNMQQQKIQVRMTNTGTPKTAEATATTSIDGVILSIVVKDIKESGAIPTALQAMRPR